MSWLHNEGFAAALGALLASALGTTLVIAQVHGAGPETIACPATITPPRPDVDVPAGWQAYWSGRPDQRLRGLEVVHGGDQPPLAFLVPSVHADRHVVVGRWDLRSYANDPRPIWIYCQYENTALRLTRALAPHRAVLHVYGHRQR